MTGIFIITYNTPIDVFICQIEAIKKFCEDDYYTIEVFDNSDSGQHIEYHALQMGVNYNKVKAVTGDSSRSHAFAANLAFHIKQKEYDNFFFLDHDCIPIKNFNVKEELVGLYGKGLGQGTKKTYFWPGCFMFSSNISNLIDFYPNGEFGLDTGGNLYRIIEEYGIEEFQFIGEEYRENPEYNGKYNFYSIIDGRFMHFINTSNWNRQEDNEQRINSLLGIAKKYINDTDIR